MEKIKEKISQRYDFVSSAAPSNCLLGFYSMSGDGEKDGLATAVAEAMAQAEPLAPEGEQLALLPAVAEASEAGAGDQAPADGKRGPGRPPGSRNKRTDELLDVILASNTHPLLWLAQRWSKTPAQLAADLGVKPTAKALLELDGRQQAAAIAALPYMAQKQPVAVDVNAKSVTLIMSLGGESAPEADFSGSDEGITIIDAVVGGFSQSDGISGG